MHVDDLEAQEARHTERAGGPLGPPGVHHEAAELDGADGRLVPLDMVMADLEELRKHDGTPNWACVRHVRLGVAVGARFITASLVDLIQKAFVSGKR